MSTESLIYVSGAFLALMAVVAAWLFKSASAPFAFKIIIPISLMALACATPFQLPSILGWPVETTLASLPQQAELIGFVPHDDEKKVVLWLMREGVKEPRAYEVEETDALKKTLASAKKAQAAGQRTELAKGGGKPRSPAYMNLDGGEAPYELLPDALHLPSKGDAQ